MEESTRRSDPNRNCGDGEGERNVSYLSPSIIQTNSVLRISRFRLAACQLNELAKWKNELALDAALSHLPEELFEMYDRITNNILPGDKDNAVRMLQLIAYSKRPLLLEEVVDAIAVTWAGPTYFDKRRRMADAEEILQFCPGFVIAVPAHRPYGWLGDWMMEDGVYSTFKVTDDQQPVLALQFAHYSVKEYLLSETRQSSLTQGLGEVVANGSIAMTCLAYLLQLDLDTEPELRQSLLPFLLYSAEFWMSHAAVLPTDRFETLQTLSNNFFDFPDRSYEIWCSLYSLLSPVDDLGYFGIYPPPIVFASHGGLLRTVEHLLQNGVDIEAGYMNPHRTTALIEAAEQGHKEIVDLLLGHEAKVDACNGAGMTALHCAAEAGQVDAVRVLLTHDTNNAEVDQKNDRWGTALVLAAKKGHDTTVRLLLEHKAEIEARNDSQATALIAAARHGHTKIVDMLLTHNANGDARDKFGSTALIYAASRGHELVVDRLLTHKTNRVRVDRAYSSTYTPLVVAAQQGYDRIVELLLVRNFNKTKVGWLNVHGDTALDLAVRCGHHRIIRLLLEHKPEFDEQDPNDLHILISVAEEGLDWAVAMLLKPYIESETQAKVVARALVVVAKEEHQKAIGVLLRYCNEEKARDETLVAAITKAIEDGKERELALLLEHHVE